MDRWALEFAERAAFICVGCAGSSLASTFVRDLKLKHTSVTYCAESDMPSWGQLGCGGFIVLDGAGKVAHAKTSAFMQVRDLAFRHVEALVGALCAGAAVPRVAPGVFVVLHGLVVIVDGREQLTVKVAELAAVEGLPLDRVPVELQDVALQGQDDNARATPRVGDTIGTVVSQLDEVQAVLHEA